MLPSLAATLVAVDDHEDEADSTTASMEAQLIALYEDKSELQDALGVSTSEEIITLFHERKDDSSSQSLILQLESLYAEHAELREALGVSTASDVIALVARLRGSVRQLLEAEKRRLEDQSLLLTFHERNL